MRLQASHVLFVFKYELCRQSLIAPAYTWHEDLTLTDLGQNGARPTSHQSLGLVNDYRGPDSRREKF